MYLYLPKRCCSNIIIVIIIIGDVITIQIHIYMHLLYLLSTDEVNKINNVKCKLYLNSIELCNSQQQEP